MTRGKNIDRIVQTIDQIPSLPIISEQIQDIFKNENVSIKDIEKVILQDPPLAARMLRLVNSSFYGLLNKISSIEHALVILGFKEVKNIVLGFSIQNYFSNQTNSFDRKRFWRHSIVCSQINNFLGKHYNIVDDGTFFLSGLIHDIGKLVIDQYFNDDFESVVDYISVNNCSFSKAEKEVLGVTHYQIAAKLLQQWNFPKRVIMEIFYHHAPWHDRNYTSGSIILYLANMLTKFTGYTCHASEPTTTAEDIINPSIRSFINKNGFELDEETLNVLMVKINEFLASESMNIMSIFD